MAKISRFEDLICWQKARELVNRIYEVSKTEHLFKDYRLRDQLRSAAVSIMSNIAEGFSRYHKKEFIRFLNIAQSSTTEVKSLLYVVQDQHYIPASEIQSLQKSADDCRYLTLGLLKYCSKNLNGKSDKIKEPLAEYMTTEGSDFLNLPDEFVNQELEHSNT